jgi:hypothetical protein|tara:strand:- start:88 stop:639 length:552 start_codon:yes stop_codon:yes gene_type:complete
MFDIKDHLIVKDNFFKPEFLSKIHNELLNSTFVNRFVDYNNGVYQKIYFNIDLDNDHYVVQEVFKTLNERYNLDIEFLKSHYFLSTKHEKATPHNDIFKDGKGDENYLNCLIFLKGEELLNSGTGFYDYDKETNEYNLNRHVGFKVNRAIIFDSKIYHASLQFNTQSAKRYVMANFCKKIKKN